jgi:membrane-associated protein
MDLLLDLLHFFTNLDTQLGSVIATHGNLIYAILFVIIVCEIGLLPLFFLPGDPLIFITGSFCKLGALELPVMMATLMIAALCGNLISYRIGAMVGESIDSHPYRWINRKALERTRAFYKKHGETTLLISPFIAVVRTFAPFLAGVSRMSFGQYVVAANIGTSFWIASLMLAGYFFGEIPFVREHMASIILSGLGIGLACIIIGASLSGGKQKP